MPGGICRLSASPSVGETAVMLLPKSGLTGTLNPFTAVFGSIKRFVCGFKSLFKNKKKLIPALVLAFLWILLSLLPMLGVNNAAVKTLSSLTFAQGGYSKNIVNIIGGLLGKGMVAAVFVSLFSGGLKSTSGGLKQTVSSFKNSIKNTESFCLWLMGTGFALVFYNFTVGKASVWQGMAGIAGLLLCLRAFGTSGGFLRNILTSLTANKSNGIRHENKISLQSLLSGMACGFAIAVIMSPIPFAYAPYCAGLAFTVTAAVSLLVLRPAKGRAVT
ncbi:MAG: hypothetical protein PHW77_00135 [Eubacteriales bacterium]|nr:hypothetical protein [Eubacteriales bacterium]